MSQFDMDDIYRNLPLDKIPWQREQTPEELLALLNRGTIKPCKALDLGCGTGSYAIYLAEQGFEVTGVDSSATAINLAREMARKKGVSCTFVVADVLSELDKVPGTFDFAYDWTLLHHIFPEQREQYIANVYRKLNPSGLYLSVSFSQHDPQFSGTGKYYTTSIGTTLYLSSEQELRDLFAPHFSIQDLRTIQIPGKTIPHLAVCALLQKE